MTQALKTRRSKAQKEQLNLVRHGQSQIELVSKPVSEPVSELQVINGKLSKTTDQLHAAQQNNTNLYGALRVERRKYQRTVASKKKLEKNIKLLQSVELPNAKGDAARAIQLLEQTRSTNMHLKHDLSQLLEKCILEASKTKAKQADVKAKLLASKLNCRNMQK
jgi:hypothetical protein